MRQFAPPPDCPPVSCSSFVPSGIYRALAILLSLGWACTTIASAPPLINRVEPPNWWVSHSWHSLQVLLTGTDLTNATVTTTSPGFQISTRFASDNGHYLFVYVDIGREVVPGTYHFQVQNAGGSAGFDLPLATPPSPGSGFQGFGPEDVIYLLMPDRFAHGGPTNNFDALHTNPPSGGRAGRGGGQSYHGGNLRGITEHLDYLKDLGVTGVWMTPVYQNSGPNNRGAYHGYSTIDYYGVEPRFGTLQDFRNLVIAAHEKGLKVVQDQVANHCGPGHPWVADPPTKTWFNNPQSRTRNNFDIASLADPYSRPARQAVPVRGWFAGILPDLNQEDPLVRDYEIQNALWWIGSTGLDGIRQDTYPYVPRSFWEPWQAALDHEFPQLVCVAEITAETPAVLSFFEGGTRRAGIDTGLRSALDFPLEYATRRAFGSNAPLSDLANVLAQDSLYLHPERLVTFVGNHDQPRFLSLAGGDIDKLLLAQTFTLTTRRTAHLYYGDEIALTNSPGSGDATYRVNFPGGFPGDLVNAFIPAGRTGEVARVFNWTRDLLHFRQAHSALRNGGLVNLLSRRDQYAYLRTSPEEYVLVLLNRGGSTNAFTLPVEDLGLPEDLKFQSFPAGSPDLAISGGRVIIPAPRPIEIYWAPRTGKQN